jgi:hypothetical protein
MGNGDQAGNWGQTTNINLGTLIEQAISGYVTQAITDGADTVITIPNGATGVARNMFIECTGSLSAARNLIVPSNRKLYFIYNNTTGGYALTVKVSGQTGVSVPNGAKVALVSNGTDIVSAENYLATLNVGGNETVGGTLNVIGNTTLGGTLGVSGAVTGASFSGAGTGLTGTASSLSIGGSAASATNVTGTVAVANGGTGLTTLTANNVILGNGTSTPSFVAPGTSGNVLTSNGTTWQSSTPASAPVSSVNGQTGAVTTTSVNSIGATQRFCVYSGSNQFAGATISGGYLYYATGSTSNQQGSIWTQGSGSTNPNSSPTCIWQFISNSVLKSSSGNTGLQPPSGNVSTVSGTWRCMDVYSQYGVSYYFGCCGNNYTGSYMYMSIWVRVS